MEHCDVIRKTLKPQDSLPHYTMNFNAYLGLVLNISYEIIHKKDYM